MRFGLAVLGLALLSAPARAADTQIKPYIGVTFAGATTFVDPEKAVDKASLAIGVSAVALGDVLGVEGDVGYGPGFFQTGSRHLVLSSSVTTVTGNVIVALPRRLTEYTLRPYFVGGLGLMRARIDNDFGVLPVSANMAAFDVGGGVTGFLTNRVGVSWEVRHFRSFGEDTQVTGVSIGPEQLSFWRASMAVAIRY